MKCCTRPEETSYCQRSRRLRRRNSCAVWPADGPGTPSPILCSPDGTSSEVMLEVEVDGVRYLLLRSWPKSPPRPSGASRREAEIARLVAAGYPNKIIADVLDISPWTVCTNLRRIFRPKIGVSCRAAMVARLLAEGVIHSDSRSLTERYTPRWRLAQP